MWWDIAGYKGQEGKEEAGCWDLTVSGTKQQALNCVLHQRELAVHDTLLGAFPLCSADGWQEGFIAVF